MNHSCERNLVIVVHNHRYDPRDFVDIAMRVSRNAPDIKVYVVAASSTCIDLPLDVWRLPTLTVALDPLLIFRPQRGRLLIGRIIEKIEQVELMKRAGVPVPNSMLFQIGMSLDPEVWGDFVLLKPAPVEFSSHGKGVQLFRTSKLGSMGLENFREDHFARKHPMIVQEFVDTGEHPSGYRALVFCGEVLYVLQAVLDTPRPPLDASDDDLEAAQVATNGGERTVQFGDYPDVLAFAKRISAVFPDIPLLGCDIIRDVVSGKLYALEVNPGGNVWHFSSPMSADRLKTFPYILRGIHTQFGAFDVAARALIHSTRLLSM
jgi:hypothetical protein